MQENNKVLLGMSGGTDSSVAALLLQDAGYEVTGVTFRCVFAAVAFWIIGYWAKPETASVKDKIYLFLLGAVGIYGI